MWIILEQEIHSSFSLPSRPEQNLTCVLKKSLEKQIPILWIHFYLLSPWAKDCTIKKTTNSWVTRYLGNTLVAKVSTVNQLTLAEMAREGNLQQNFKKVFNNESDQDSYESKKTAGQVLLQSIRLDLHKYVCYIHTLYIHTHHNSKSSCRI